MDLSNWSAKSWSEYFKSTLPIAFATRMGESLGERELCEGNSSPFFKKFRSEISLLYKYPKSLQIKELELQGNIFELIRAISKMLWVLEDSLLINSQILLDELMKNDKFATFHIRKGDKVHGLIDDKGKKYIEAKAIDCILYYEKLKKIDPNISTVFVITDDYSDVILLRENTPLNIYSLCSESQRGWYNTEFNLLDESYRISQLKRLVTEVEVASKASIFIGAFSSNLSRFIPMIHHSPFLCFSLDSKWSPK